MSPRFGLKRVKSPLSVGRLPPMPFRPATARLQSLQNERLSEVGDTIPECEFLLDSTALNGPRECQKVWGSAGFVRIYGHMIHRRHRHRCGNRVPLPGS